VQPLLRGAGPLVAREGLLQSERSMIYSVRDFQRYQQGFVIDVADRYYLLLSTQDQLRNARSNYTGALDNREQIARLASGGRRSGIEVDQAQQAVLEAEASLSRTEKAYGRQLDLFKVFLGLPVDLDVGPDPAELRAIAERGPVRPDITLGEAIETALARRLDFLTTDDRVEDSRRAVQIALRNFLPTLQAGYSVSMSGSDDSDRYGIDSGNNNQRWSLDLGVPFDWTPKRNSYRRALMGLAKSKRALDLARDQLVLEVRDAWRELEEARTDHRIQAESVVLAERRVKMASMFLQSGRSTARDLLEAEDARLASRNALTSALVRHTIQRLGFWNAIERFEIDARGLPPDGETWTDDEE
jgi:outer membrane protein TolC